MDNNFVAYIGLDWADRKHDYCIKAACSERVEYGVLQHSPEAIDKWVFELRDRFGNQPIAICLELKSGPIVHALLKYEFIHIFPIAPQALARYRQAFTQSGAKDDPTDASLQLDYIIKHHDALRVLKPDTEETRIIQRLVEDRRTLVEDKVRLTNRITAALKNYYPQVVSWFDELDTHMFCEFITRWPRLETIKRARRSTLETFFKSHRCVRANVIEKRCQNIKNATFLTQDKAIIESNTRLVLVLAKQLGFIIAAIKDYDLEIAKRYRKHQEHEIFASLPGAGPVMGPRLLAVFGTDRQRYSSAEEVAKMTGIAPVLERSGKKCWVHWRYSCPKFVRQTFVEWVRVSTRYSYWAKTFYDKKRNEGKSHQAAIRALAYKWIRILYRCWKDRTPYDEASYLFALQRRNKNASLA